NHSPLLRHWMDAQPCPTLSQKFLLDLHTSLDLSSRILVERFNSLHECARLLTLAPISVFPAFCGLECDLLELDKCHFAFSFLGWTAAARAAMRSCRSFARPLKLQVQ